MTPKEKLTLWRTGWKHGASSGIEDEIKRGFGEYSLGFAAGVAARISADQHAAELFGVSRGELRKSVLR